MKFSQMNPESRETIISWMFAEQCGIVNNETRTYTPEFYTILEAMLSTLDPTIPARERYEIVIMEYLNMTGQSISNTESLRALSLASSLANETINEKVKQDIPVDEIIGRKLLDDNGGINE